MTDDISLTDQLQLDTILEFAEPVREDRQSVIPKNTNKDRRKSIIPSSHLPKQFSNNSPSEPNMEDIETEEDDDNPEPVKM